MTSNAYHADGGASCTPPDYKFHNAYFTVLDNSGQVLVHKDDLGDVRSHSVAEFDGIAWIVNNIKERPIIATSDSQIALTWARKRLDLTGVDLRYEHENLAGIWNALHKAKKYPIKVYQDLWAVKVDQDYRLAPVPIGLFSPLEEGTSGS